MRVRTAAAALALLVAAGPAVADDGAAAVQSTERVQFALQCVQEGSDPRCVSTNYALSLKPGTSSVGNALTITPAGYVLGTTPLDFAADSTLASSYTLVGGSTIKGRVSLRQTGSGSTPVAVDSTVSVDLAAVRVDTKRSVPLGSATVNKVVVASPSDAVYAFEFTVPAALDGVAVRALSGSVSNKQISAGYGFFDGQGGSYFDLPYYAPETAAG
ncbi:MAG TPA: hypothetical protein VM433_00030 [Mycobacteriales bacterium]|nr:hypothetical protein [Mycobacteriales bacterium]